MKRIATVLGAMLLAAVLAVAIGGAGVVPGVPLTVRAASGDTGEIVTTSAQRACSDARCLTLGTVPGGVWVQTWCWRDGGSYGGTPRWFRIRYAGRDGWVSASQMSPQPVVPYCNSLAPGEALYAGEAVWSPNGTYQLVMQGDGNLVVYGPSGALWASNTNASGSWAIMQNDGNLVVYAPNGSAPFATGTGWPGTQLVVQSDSNVVLYTGSTALWATNDHHYAGQATRTWNAGDAGNCTWYANDRWSAFWLRHQYPALTGNAADWDDSARALGYRVMGTPTTQAVVVFEASLIPPYGHVAWVDGMQPRSDGTYIHIWEMNYYGLYQVDDRWVKVVAGMSFIPAPAI